jgi:hypothetical protein
MPAAIDLKERAHVLERWLPTVRQVLGALVELLYAIDGLWSEKELALAGSVTNPMNGDLGMRKRPTVEPRITLDFVVPWDLLERWKLDSRQNLVEIDRSIVGGCFASFGRNL